MGDSMKLTALFEGLFDKPVYGSKEHDEQLAREELERERHEYAQWKKSPRAQKIMKYIKKLEADGWSNPLADAMQHLGLSNKEARFMREYAWESGTYYEGNPRYHKRASFNPDPDVLRDLGLPTYD